MRKNVLGILAHVDAGKTTLSEAILYKTGVINQLGRVDNKNSYLDSNVMERKRGITIFSKQATFCTDDVLFYMLDTPGHVDFSAEMERTLQVIDYGILVISASDGIQGHTKTLWKLLKQYNIPVFIFVNKMDQPDNHKDKILHILHQELSEDCIDFSNTEFFQEQYEHMAVAYAEYYKDDNLLEKYLDTNIIEDDVIRKLIHNRLIFPCYFGSALKLEGVDNLLNGLNKYTYDYNSNSSIDEEDEFGGKVYKVTRDEKNERLVHLKVTSGKLKVKDRVNDEKINQIRIYNGDRFETKEYVVAGEVCAVTGLDSVSTGDSLGVNNDHNMTLLEPIISYRIITPEGVSSRMIYPKLKEIEEELPEISLFWDEDNEEIKIKLMGQVQIEILKELIFDRFKFMPEFDLGTITYKETITKGAIGVGHFEPLKHYAEIHLLLEPGDRGTGINVYSDLSEDILDKNWQRLVKTHILERIHKGVLIGGDLTDVNIHIINGKSHIKHTEGGDFRQATYRAIRHGLMYCDCVILEPYYDFELIVPSNMIGRVMNDIENMSGIMESPYIIDDMATISGRCPVATMRDYQVNVNSFTKGKGTLSVRFSGYDICHNQEEIIDSINYNPELDINNPTSSVFCSHGAGFIVPWYDVHNYMHLVDNEKDDFVQEKYIINREKFDYSIGTEEIDEILGRTYNSNVKKEKNPFKKKREADYFEYTKVKVRPNIKDKIYLIDGYNVIFAWNELKELSTLNIDAAKDKLISILSEYKAIVDLPIHVIFDGYKVKNNLGSIEEKEDIFVIHTKEGETADAYIERYSNSNKDKLNITVVTSDNLIRQLTSGNNCNVISSLDFEKEISLAKNELRERYKLD